ncbi:DNA-processing protein DprA [Psychrobacter lutiphocae]|uniref:DNA-processing protein DprA n=1 Tax=Psychrobacter lutiphocae TaxID=540500 RepID=UPI00037BD90E|nr:DNA-processing protein DprA [Psychrobacter lutiphocae]
MIPIPKPTDGQLLTAEQQAVLVIWQRVNTSLSAFYKLQQHFGSAVLAKQATASQWTQLGIHHKHVERHQQATDSSDCAFVETLEKQLANNEFQLVFQGEDGYPQQLLDLFDPPPVLFYRGDLSRLQQPQIAIVGSRKPSQKAQKFTFDMAQYLAQAGFVITSGLAQGVDVQAHLGALAQAPEAAGRTIGVMGTGIDVCYPSQHQYLFERIIQEGGCIISELFPKTLPHKHTFPRRNRLVAGLSLGTVVTEATIQSGSLITARLTSEQGKQVFALPSSIDNANAEGCHYLIREGATLIYHPDQVIADLSSQLLMPVYQPTSNAAHDASTRSLPNSYQDTQSESQLDSQLDIPPNQQTNRRINNQENEQKTQRSGSLFKRQSQQEGAVNSGIKIKAKAKPVLTTQKPVKIAQHLQPLWMHLEFEPQDLDVLVHKTQLDTAALLTQLIELELLGLIAESGGRYRRI